MSRTARRFWVVAAIGAALVAVFGLSVAWAGGVPYIDGPDSGHISGPGLGRWIEQYAPVSAAAGVLLIIIGVAGALTQAWLHRRQ